MCPLCGSSLGRRVGTAVLALATLAVAGCFGGGDPVVISTPRKGCLLAKGKLRVEETTTTVEKDKLNLCLSIANVSTETVVCDVAVKWLDEELEAVGSPTWQALTIAPGETLKLESTAAADKAVHYELLIR